MIRYEFPLNERIRKFIRVEELFLKIDVLATSAKKYTEFSLFERLFELMLTASRSDLKVDLIQEIERQKLKLRSKAKTQANNALMVKLSKAKTKLEKAKIQPGFYFGDDKYLQEIKSRKDSPYGITSVDFPEFQFWLQCETPLARKDYFKQKIAPFQPIKEAIFVVLALLRSSAKEELVSAERGVFQKKLDPSLKNDLITISMNLRS
ncbi:MAG: hypothetical protein ABS06_05640, partial [Methylophilales bacterium BACL14 MAG-120910-bin43]